MSQTNLWLTVGSVHITKILGPAARYRSARWRDLKAEHLRGTALPRQKRHVVFGKGELFRSCMSVLRTAKEPLTSRMVAQQIVELNGQDARDRKYVNDLVKRVGKCLRQTDAARKGTDGMGNA